jgi:hypothetical protein
LRAVDSGNPESTARNHPIKPQNAGSLVMNGTYGAQVESKSSSLLRLL